MNRITVLFAAALCLWLASNAAANIEKEVAAHLEQRKELIGKLMLVAQTPATDQLEIVAKADAIRVLGELRAVEAVDVIVREINFRDPFVLSSESIPEKHYPALKALIQIGKPGSLAALKAIAGIKIKAGDQEITAEEMKLISLIHVIHGVEGSDVAEFLLKRDMQKADKAMQFSYERALKYLRDLGNAD